MYKKIVYGCVFAIAMAGSMGADYAAVSMSDVVAEPQESVYKKMLKDMENDPKAPSIFSALATDLGIMAYHMNGSLIEVSNKSLIYRAQKLHDIYPDMLSEEKNKYWESYYNNVSRVYKEIATRYNSNYEPWNWGHDMKRAYEQMKELQPKIESQLEKLKAEDLAKLEAEKERRALFVKKMREIDKIQIRLKRLNAELKKYPIGTSENKRLEAEFSKDVAEHDRIMEEVVQLIKKAPGYNDFLNPE
jgi:hypothetical protein